MSNPIETRQPTPLLNAALADAQGEMPAVPLDSRNPFLKNRYASLGSVIATSRPVLAKYGLSIEQQPYTRENKVGIKTILRHKSGESSESELDVSLTEEKGKSAAQMVGSIITYLRRYAWASVCGLYADEDTDGNAADSPPRSTASHPNPKPAPAPQPTVKAPESAPKRTPKEEKAHADRMATWLNECKATLINRLSPAADSANEYAAKVGLILPGVETLADVSPIKLFPTVDLAKTPNENRAAIVADANRFEAAVQSFMDGNQIPGAETAPPINVGRKPDPEWFFDIVVPVPRKGQKRDEYLKAPDTIRSLYDQRHGTDEESQLARERLYGFLNHFEPKGWTKKDGTQMPASETDHKFREALDAFGEHLEKIGEKL